MKMAKDSEKVHALDLELSSWGLKKSMSYEGGHKKTFEAAPKACAFAETTRIGGCVSMQQMNRRSEWLSPKLRSEIFNPDST